MTNKFIYNDKGVLLDSRDLEILIDCLEAGAEAYEDDEDADEDASSRIARMITAFKA